MAEPIVKLRRRTTLSTHDVSAEGRGPAVEGIPASANGRMSKPRFNHLTFSSKKTNFTQLVVPVM